MEQERDPRVPVPASALGLGDVDASRAQRRRAGADAAEVRRFAAGAARLMDERHCGDVVAFDIQGLSDVTDYVLIASGTSNRQIKAVGQEVQELAAGHGLVRYGKDMDEGSTWLVLDFVDAVVHLFDPETRSHYDLEMMWDDAPRVDWRQG